jgi:hypothetical protein
MGRWYKGVERLAVKPELLLPFLDQRDAGQAQPHTFGQTGIQLHYKMLI